MLTLALSTSADLCSIAVRDGDGTLVARAFRHRMHLSERLLGDVEALLSDAGVGLTAVDWLAVDVGPGSFTGLRIGVMTVKTWADVLAKPVAAVTALEALAASCAAPADTVVVPVIRARPGTVYAQPFRVESGLPVDLASPRVLAPADLAVLVPPTVACVVCGEGLRRDGAAIQAALSAAGITAALGEPEPPRAAVVARVAAARLAAGSTSGALTLTPLYVAPPPIDPSIEARIASQTDAQPL